mmetsp:Transcript_22676/g.47679  ORF Transcript_22676/g.47679 Transcript_22676/m.47679 type:complete len:220 (-) Transcript_22676:138-797(-)
MQSGIDDDADMDGLSDDCAPLEARKQRRKHRNRLSAAASRQRKKEWVDALQDQLKLLAAENAALKQRLQSFAGESSCSTSSGGFDMDSARLPPTESNRCKATAAAKAGAAAGLLAFRAVAAAPAADAIASDLVLGARLRAHRIEDIVQIMMASEHLAAAAAAAASGAPEAARPAGWPVVREASKTSGLGWKESVQMRSALMQTATEREVRETCDSVSEE